MGATPTLDTQTVTVFFALLAGLAQAVVVFAVVLALAARTGRLRQIRERVVASVGPQALALATLVALVCTAGSLYLSEVAGFPPCKLCWYQRIAMYPLVIVLGLAAWRKDYSVGRYVVPLCGIGGVISVYHIMVERMPALEGGACDPTNPCSIIWVQHLGYMTIPTMALSGFALITTLCLTARAWQQTAGGQL